VAVEEDEFRAQLQLNAGQLWWRQTVGFGGTTETLGGRRPARAGDWTRGSGAAAGGERGRTAEGAERARGAGRSPEASKKAASGAAGGGRQIRVRDD
jgi:hypothetical protein